MNQAPGTIEWAPGGEYGTVNYVSDQNLNVVFYKKSEINVQKSQQEGIAIHEDRDYIKIMQPGERLNVIDRPVYNEDKKRFSAQWARYITDQVQTPEGTPIALLFPNNPAAADNLRVMGIHTIQQCAAMTDHAMTTVGMGGLEYKTRATRYLESAKDGGKFHEMQKILDVKQTEINELKFKLSEQGKLIADLQKRMDNPGLYDKTNPKINEQTIPDIQGQRIAANFKEIVTK
jgi:hypothetical protein